MFCVFAGRCTTMLVFPALHPSHSSFCLCPLYLTANQQRERHARLVAANQGAEGAGAGLGDGHGQQCHQLQRQLHHPSDDICIGACVLRVPNELYRHKRKSSIKRLFSPAADVMVCLLPFFFSHYVTLSKDTTGLGRDPLMGRHSRAGISTLV